MQLHSQWQNLDPSARGTSCAMGNFDGVHLGHRAVIDLARGSAPLGVITFEPHPRSFFAPDAPAFRLMSAASQASRLRDIGVEHLFRLPFDNQFCALGPEDFARDVLAKGLGLSHVVVGADFCFGKGRAGTAADLRALGEKYGFRTTIADLITAGDRPISSSAIRRALSEGRPRDAAAMLGDWHSFEGEVIHGEKRGRELGFPTANMSPSGLHLPCFGVYAVKVEILTGPHKGHYNGAANLGIRPMFDDDRPNLETYILDFKGDIYGETLCISLVDYLRPELRFDSLDALIARMGEDTDRAREILTAL